MCNVYKLFFGPTYKKHSPEFCCTVVKYALANGAQLLPFVLISKYTLAQNGSSLVSVPGTSDYCQITGTFGITMAGGFLSIQLIYQGKTSQCQPNYNFPKEFHITQTPNHWANENKSIPMLKEILIPYIEAKRKGLDLPDKPWLLISDVFKGQWTEIVKDPFAS